jgi:hypothetical protein
MLGKPAWRVHTARGPLEKAGRLAAPLLSGGRTRPWLISAVNVLNEWRQGRRHQHNSGVPRFVAGAQGALSRRGEGGGSFPDMLRPFFHGQRDGRVSSPALLVVEPGTRLGGKTVMRLREQARETGLAAHAPCPHTGLCPLLAGEGGSWCHFTFDRAGAPEWLEHLSREAGLAKRALSLAFLLLRQDAEKPGEGNAGEAGNAAVRARVLSAPIAVPGLAGRARYACSAKGLLLLEDAECLARGDLLRVRPAPDAPVDAKSRARIVRKR